MTDAPTTNPLVRRRAETEPLECPFGHVQRIVTGGEGGVANVHVVRVTKGLAHVHAAYDEVYYVLSGRGALTVGGATHAIAPGSVAVIPAGAVHALAADPGDELEFVIFGSPAMPIDDARAQPTQATGAETGSSEP
jgi:quercetin dioxygenase-like cupin family protein